MERANSVVKKRFYILQTSISVCSITRAAELIQCAAILHNLGILFNDHGTDPLENEDLHIEDDEFAEHRDLGARRQATRAIAVFSVNLSETMSQGKWTKQH